MKNSNETVTFKATLEELHPSGKAVLFSNCKQGKELLFSSVYMPRSQSNIKVVNAKTKLVEVTIPLWLFDSKVKDEQQFQATDDSVFDQLGLLSIDDANRDFPEPVVDRLADERPE